MPSVRLECIYFPFSIFILTQIHHVKRLITKTKTTKRKKKPRKIREKRKVVSQYDVELWTRRDMETVFVHWCVSKITHGEMIICPNRTWLCPIYIPSISIKWQTFVLTCLQIVLNLHETHKSQVRTRPNRGLVEKSKKISTICFVLWYQKWHKNT